MLKTKLTPESLAAYFDHTLLRADATEQDFKTLCSQAKEYGFKMVAINPAPVALCKKLLEGTPVHVGAAIGFPLGQTTLASKVFDTKDAIQNGADEIDYVINITQLKNKNFTYITDEMRAIVEACKEGGATSKVIFENCYLTQDEKKKLCEIALQVGPDYIKTSTGFGTGGATIADIQLMKAMVADKIKVKASGGVRTLDMALALIEAGVSRIGSSASVDIVNTFKYFSSAK